RIQLFDRWSKNEIHAIPFAHHEVRLHGSRISRVILIRAKLKRVNKDGHDEEVALRSCGLDEFFMASVKRPHCGHKANVSFCFEKVSNFVNGVDHPHGHPRCMRAQRKGSVPRAARTAWRMEGAYRSVRVRRS